MKARKRPRKLRIRQTGCDAGSIFLDLEMVNVACTGEPTKYIGMMEISTSTGYPHVIELTPKVVGALKAWIREYEPALKKGSP